MDGNLKNIDISTLSKVMAYTKLKDAWLGVRRKSCHFFFLQTKKREDEVRMKGDLKCQVSLRVSYLGFK
jgi:hypothetical protein